MVSSLQNVNYYSNQWMDPIWSKICLAYSICRSIFSFVWLWSFCLAIFGSKGIYVISNLLESFSWKLPYQASMLIVPQMDRLRQSPSIQRVPVLDQGGWPFYKPRTTTGIFYPKMFVDEDRAKNDAPKNPIWHICPTVEKQMDKLVVVWFSNSGVYGWLWIESVCTWH